MDRGLTRAVDRFASQVGSALEQAAAGTSVSAASLRRWFRCVLEAEHVARAAPNAPTRAVERRHLALLRAARLPAAERAQLRRALQEQQEPQLGALARRIGGLAR